MRNKVIAFFVIAAAGIVGLADTATYGITSVMGGAADLYGINDGVWRKIRTIISSNDGHTVRLDKAIYVDGIIYVFDMVKDPNNDGTGSDVHKYTPAGKYLGKLGHCGGQAEGFCISSDRKHLYLGYAFQTMAGCIDRMSLEDGSVETVATGLGAIRQICTDMQGKLYAAARNGVISIIDEKTGSVQRTSQSAQGVAYDSMNDCIWWSQMNTSNYGTMDRDGNVTATYTDAQWGNQCFAISVINGLPHFAGYGNKIYRRNADGSWTTVLSVQANYCGLDAFEVERRDVAKVYLTVPSANIQNGGVRRFVVDNLNEWRDDGWLFKCDTQWTTRPVACLKAGDYFYACDQYADQNLGYFSIGRYDESGAFRGKVVEKWGMSGIKVDNMTASRDGKTLYVTCFAGNTVLKVDIATGEVSVFTQASITSPRACSVDSDDRLYVCNRVTGGNVTIYNSDGSKHDFQYAFDSPTGIYCDRELDRIYVNNSSGNGYVFRKGVASSIATYSGIGNAMGSGKISDGILDNMVFGNWAGEVYTMATGSNTPTRKLSSLGNIQHVCVVPIRETAKVLPDASTLTFAAPADGVWLVARDNARAANDPEVKTTVWGSTDRGASWKLHSEVAGLATPTVIARSGKIILFGEFASKDGVRVVGGKTLAADGTWEDDFSFSFNRSYSGFNLVGGTVQAAEMWNATRMFMPLGMSGKRSLSGVSLTDVTRGDYPDCCFCIKPNTRTEDYFNTPNAEYRSLRTNYKSAREPSSCPSAEGGVVTFQPVELRRTSLASRMPHEYVEVYTNYSAGNTPEFVGCATLPGGSKQIGVVWDSESGLYWAVTTPELDEQAFLVSDPSDTRNTIMLYASDNMFNWRKAGVVRLTEGTKDTVAFSHLCLSIDGNDLVMVYKVDGVADPSKATPVTVDGSIVFQRVVNFRSMRPTFAHMNEQLLIPDWYDARIQRISIDSESGEWYADGSFPCPASYPIGMACVNRKIYIACETTGIYEYSAKGKCLRNFPAPSGRKVDAIQIFQGGRYALVSDCGSNPHAVMKLDLITGEWRILADATTDSKFKGPRALAVAMDGTFFVGFRDSSEIRHYTADGQSYDVIASDVRGPVSLAYDDASGMLYCGTRFGQVMKYEVKNGNVATELTYPLANLENGAFSLFLKNGRLYCVDGALFEVFELDPNKAGQDPKVVYGGGHFAGRGVFVDMSNRGLFIMVR